MNMFYAVLGDCLSSYCHIYIVIKIRKSTSARPAVTVIKHCVGEQFIFFQALFNFFRKH